MKNDEIFNKVSALFQSSGKFHYYYVKNKIKSDPVYNQLLNFIPKDGNIIDLGCGRGLASMVLKIANPQLNITGIDWDNEKLNIARKISTNNNLNINFVEHDIFEFQPGNQLYNMIICFDLLHYLPVNKQDDFINYWAQFIDVNGCFLIRDFDTDQGLRSMITNLGERIFTKINFNKGAGIYPRSMSEIKDIFEKKGFTVQLIPSWGNTPFSNMLLISFRRVE